MKANPLLLQFGLLQRVFFKTLPILQAASFSSLVAISVLDQQKAILLSVWKIMFIHERTAQQYERVFTCLL